MANPLIDTKPVGMKRVHISGKMVISFRQHIDLPEDEVAEFVNSEDIITTNVDLDRAAWEVEEWNDIETRVRDVPKGYLE